MAGLTVTVYRSAMLPFVKPGALSLWEHAGRLRGRQQELSWLVLRRLLVRLASGNTLAGFEGLVADVGDSSSSPGKRRDVFWSVKPLGTR